MKLCKDCKFCVVDKDFPNGRYAKCTFRKSPTGFDNDDSGAMYCSLNREYDWLEARLLKLCGKEGRWFQPKEGA